MTANATSCEVLTKFGTLLLEFVDPNADGTHDRRGQPISEYDKTVARLSGELTINGIPCKISTRLRWETRYDDAGNLKSREIGEHYASSYNRRTDSTFGTPFTDGMARKFRDLISTEIAEVYVARTDLQRNARLAQQAYLVQQAEDSVNTAQTELNKAVAELSRVRATTQATVATILTELEVIPDV